MPYPFSSGPSRKAFWFGVIFWGIATALLLGCGLNGLYEDHLFSQKADRTQGRVESSFKQSSVGRYGNNRIQRFLAYSYAVNGVSYSSGDILVTAATWNAYGLHQQIPVIYLRDEPANSRPDLPRETQLALWSQETAILLGGLFLFLGLGVLATTKRRVIHIT